MKTGPYYYMGCRSPAYWEYYSMRGQNTSCCHLLVPVLLWNITSGSVLANRIIPKEAMNNNMFDVCWYRIYQNQCCCYSHSSEKEPLDFDTMMTKCTHLEALVEVFELPRMLKRLVNWSKLEN